MTDQQADLRLSHPLGNGAWVTVFSLFIFKHPFIEGVAEIIGPVAGIPNFYQVRFEDERLILERFVHPGEWQSDPKAKLRQLLDHWRLSVTPEIANEFYPND